MSLQEITRTDRAYCRKWTSAHRKGKPTAEITREWLAKLKRPAPPVPKYVPVAGCATATGTCWSFMSPLSEFSKSSIGLSADDEAYADYYRDSRRDYRDDE